MPQSQCRPFRAWGRVWAWSTQAVGLGFVRSPLRGSGDEPRAVSHRQLVTLSGAKNLGSCDLDERRESSVRVSFETRRDVTTASL